HRRLHRRPGDAAAARGAGPARGPAQPGRGRQPRRGRPGPQHRRQLPDRRPAGRQRDAGARHRVGVRRPPRPGPGRDREQRHPLTRSAVGPPYLRRHRPRDHSRPRVDPDNSDARRIAMTATTLTRLTDVRDGGRLLRFALRIDAAGSGALGLLGLAAAAPLADLTGMTAGELVGTGAFLVGYALVLVLLAARPVIPRAGARTVVGGNTLWVLGSVGAVVAGRDALTPFGVSLVLVPAAALAVFVELQWLGLCRARCPRPGRARRTTSPARSGAALRSAG